MAKKNTVVQTKGKGEVVAGSKKKAVAAPALAALEVKKSKKSKVKETRLPDMAEQLDEKGNIELVDKNKFPFEVVCDECASIRYVAAAGLSTITKCKWHAARKRRQLRSVAKREKAKKYTVVIKEALEQGLFSDKFIKKHGLAK